MTFKEGLIAARSHIAVTLGLITTGIIVFLLSDIGVIKVKVIGASSERRAISIQITPNIPIAKNSSLTKEDIERAKIAWKYFERNYNPETGLVNSVDGFPFTTLWDTASYLLGTISAYRIGIIDQEIFHERVVKLLNTLAKLPLYHDQLPNKSYNTKTLQMVDYNNKPTKEGIGWSAIDIGRLFVPLNVLVYEYSEYIPLIKKVIGRWKFDRMFKDGLLYGTGHTGTMERIHQEGRLGYEEYVSKSFALLGFDVSRAYDYLDWTGLIDIYGVKVPVDIRMPEKFGAHTYMLSEPYILDGLEFGWDYYSREFSYRVYLAQERRFEKTNILTAVTETALDMKPYFVYNTVYADGKLWACMTDKGRHSEKWRTISTKAALGWAYLYNTPYTKLLEKKVAKLYDKDKGFYSGIYEVDGRINKVITCNTNGIILEMIHYKKEGPFLKFSTRKWIGADK